MDCAEMLKDIWKVGSKEEMAKDGDMKRMWHNFYDENQPQDFVHCRF